MAENVDRRIVLLGKTGTGKSSLANTIFGAQLFQESHRSVSGTNACVSKTKTIDGRNIQLIDTPGLFDTDPDSTELSPELLKCVTECAPGPHAFLIVLKLERFTRQEQATVDVILKYFSEEALKYATVVFTHGDQLEEGQNIIDWAKDNEALTTLIEKCGGRCHVFDNRRWNNSQHPYRNNQYQVRELLETIDQTVEGNRGGYYSNDMLREVHEDIQREARTESCQGLLQRAKEVVYDRLKRSKGEVVVGVVLGALLGTGAMVKLFVHGDPGPDLIQRAAKGAMIGGLSAALLDSETLEAGTEYLRVLRQTVRATRGLVAELGT